MNTKSFSSKDPVRVMLVDDSAVVRGLLARVLTEDPEIEIAASVGNGQLAVDQVKGINPDILILDVEMPVMDGLTALPLLLKAQPGLKIIICSTLSVRNADVTLKALSMGAVDTIAKPTAAGNILSGGNDFKTNLINMIKEIGRARRRPALSTPPSSQPVTGDLSSPRISSVFKLRPPLTITPGKPEILAIGSSTGGPQALFNVLKHCANLPIPIVITQHMPPTFTAMLATHITQNSGIPAAEGMDGQTLEPGRVYIAPGGRHMIVIRPEGGGKPIIRLTDDPPENFCRPAVDPLFRSLIPVYGGKVLSVILTGMGYDGLAGAEKLVAAGARLYAQDEATSVVWGMPGAVASANICHAVLPLNDLGPLMRRTVLTGIGP